MVTRRRRSDKYNLSYDAPPPRLATQRAIRKATELREELNGEAHKKAVSKVTLPKFSWDKKDE